MRDVLIQANILAYYNQARGGKILGISEDVFCTRMAEFNIERTRQPEEWPEWTIGTPLGKLEESYILQTWLYTGYRFTKTTEVLEEPMWRVGATVYNRYEYGGI